MTTVSRLGQPSPTWTTRPAVRKGGRYGDVPAGDRPPDRPGRRATRGSRQAGRIRADSLEPGIFREELGLPVSRRGIVPQVAQVLHPSITRAARPSSARSRIGNRPCGGMRADFDADIWVACTIRSVVYPIERPGAFHRAARQWIGQRGRIWVFIHTPVVGSRGRDVPEGDVAGVAGNATPLAGMESTDTVVRTSSQIFRVIKVLRPANWALQLTEAITVIPAKIIPCT
jgi:hypothetical protein